MNKRLLTQASVAIGAVILIGAVSAQAYYTHQLAERVAAHDVAAAPADPAGILTTPSASTTSQAASDPWAAMNAQMARMQAQMDQMFNSAFQTPAGMDFVDGQGADQVTLNEKAKDYVVTAKIPGAKKGDINVRLSGRLLTLSSRAAGGSSQSADNGKRSQREQYASSFQQAFTLPGPVNASEMKSDFKDGVLTLTIPKA